MSNDLNPYRVALSCGHTAMYYPKPELETFAYCYRCADFQIVVGFPVTTIQHQTVELAEVRVNRWYLRCDKCPIWQRSFEGTRQEAILIADQHALTLHQIPQLVERPHNG